MPLTVQDTGRAILFSMHNCLDSSIIIIWVSPLSYTCNLSHFSMEFLHANRTVADWMPHYCLPRSYIKDVRLWLYFFSGMVQHSIELPNKFCSILE